MVLLVPYQSLHRITRVLSVILLICGCSGVLIAIFIPAFYQYAILIIGVLALIACILPAF